MSCHSHFAVAMSYSDTTPPSSITPTTQPNESQTQFTATTQVESQTHLARSVTPPRSTSNHEPGYLATIPWLPEN